MSLSADDDRLADFVKRNKRRKSKRIASTHKKQNLDQINEDDGATRSPSEIRMFDTFDTVSLGRDDSDQIVVEGPSGVDDKDARVEVPPTMDEVVLEEAQPNPSRPVQPEQPSETEVEAPLIVVEEEKEPEPIIVENPVQSEQPSKSEVEAPLIVVEQKKEPEQTSKSEVEAPLIVVEEGKKPEQQSDVEPDPTYIENPLEPELTLKPWLNPEAETTAARGPTNSVEEIITDVLLSMKKEDKGEEDNQDQQTGDQEQCNILEAVTASMEERCFIWATIENNNKYDIIFQLRGPNTIEAMRYNFMTMAPRTCIDMYMVSLVCHILNREQLQRFQREIYCVPPEILIRMFETHGTNFMDRKTKKPKLFTDLKDQQFIDLLDKEKLRMSRADQLDGFREEIVAKVLLSEHNTLNFEAMNQSRIMTREAITEGEPN
ncbi:hypothetical protein PIB30_006956 [Stylosanthes scabra]|uniref:Uncharacterized protein n=1 Tax=Stylosanthes scabra TaxID=79078 RepID=A0ABU6Y4I3_9FABA|nr:hypothetical protein [Stylosanthes scabra]